MDVPSARSPPALFLITYRVLSSLSYHIHQTMWSLYMKNQLHFGPADYGRFFSSAGLFFAISQGILAPRVLQYFPSPRTRGRLLGLASLAMAATRSFVFWTTNRVTLYALFAVMVSAFGLSSTIVSADMSHLASARELGTFFGLLAALDSACGMAGPLIGGALGHYVHQQAPIWAVIFLNGTIFLMVNQSYDSIVLAPESNMRVLSRKKTR